MKNEVTQYIDLVDLLNSERIKHELDIDKADELLKEYQALIDALEREVA